jgi:hypothetical protein
MSPLAILFVVSISEFADDRAQTESRLKETEFVA